MKPRRNRRIILASRPAGLPGPEHFAHDERLIESLAEGQFLVRNRYLSIDPAQRGWVNASANYSEPVPVGEVMRSLAVGVVEESNSAHVPVGERVYGWFGWQDYCVASDSAIICRVDPERGSDSAGLGIFGINGVTAYLALTEIGQPKKGETVVVSTGAGAVGSIVGQIAHRLGAYVVGLTGTDQKVSQCLSEFCYDAAGNYHTLNTDQFAALCPRGIDVYFDNTSGGISDLVWPMMNVRGRIIQCGTAAIASWEPPPLGPRRERDVLTKRLRHEGFVIFDHIARFEGVVAKLAAWVKSGDIVYREDIEMGLNRAPRALAAIFKGENHGKKMIRLEGS